MLPRCAGIARRRMRRAPGKNASFGGQLGFARAVEGPREDFADPYARPQRQPELMEGVEAAADQEAKQPSLPKKRSMS